MRILLGLFFCLVFTVSCKSTKDKIAPATGDPNTSESMQTMLSGTFIISKIDTLDVTSNRLTLSFDASLNRISGFAGCNSFFGSYVTMQNTITVSDLASSKKFCQKDVMTIETTLLNALKEVNSFYLSNDSLRLSDDISLRITAQKSDGPSKSDVVRNQYQTAVKYEVVSQDNYEYIFIAETGVAITRDRALLNMANYPCGSKDWTILEKLINELDDEALDTLGGSYNEESKKGLTLAKLSIINGDVLYQTSLFEHGDPPGKIKDLVNKVLSVKENAVKK